MFYDCWALAHRINIERATAKFDDGLLTNRVLLKEPIKARKIRIE